MNRYPANTYVLTNVGLMLGQRRRRWNNIKPTLVECLALAADATYTWVWCSL